MEKETATIGYLGGKFKIRWQISEYINALAPKVYLEPFCGYCWVGERVRAQKRYFSDANEDLVLMWKALQTGWKPPKQLSREELQAIRDKGETSALRGFVETSCTFNCCWGGGLDPPRVPGAHRTLTRRIRNMMDVQIDGRDYRAALEAVDADVVYLDPPYEQMYQRYQEGWSSTSFDSDAFWEEIRKRSDGKRRILISEYKCPPDFTVVLKAHSRMGLRVRTSEGIKQDLRQELLIEYQPPKGRSRVSFGSLLG